MNSRLRQEADTRCDGPAGQSRLAATSGETRSRPPADVCGRRVVERTRLTAAGRIWPANVGGRRYLTLTDLPDGCQVYLARRSPGSAGRRRHSDSSLADPVLVNRATRSLILARPTGSDGLSSEHWVPAPSRADSRAAEFPIAGCNGRRCGPGGTLGTEVRCRYTPRKTGYSRSQTIDG